MDNVIQRIIKASQPPEGGDKKTKFPLGDLGAYKDTAEFCYSANFDEIMKKKLLAGSKQI